MEVYTRKIATLLEDQPYKKLAKDPTEVINGIQML
jgi:hypothetical protein